MISRRKLLIAISAGTLIAPRAPFAQPAGRTYRIGWLSTADLLKEPHYVAFVQRLNELGLVEGRNLSIERVHAGNRLEQLPAMAAELANRKCDVFFAGGAEATLAALLNGTRDTYRIRRSRL